MIIDCGPQIHIAAIHAQAGYNNDTPGLGILCALPKDVSVVAGGYHNSINKWSNYGAFVWQPVHIGSVRVGALSGFVTGYGRRGGNPAHDCGCCKPSYWENRVALNPSTTCLRI